MSYRHNKKWVVIILAPGESKRPERLKCIFEYCGRTMMAVNRDVALVIKDNKGVHWGDLPADVTVVEHKCRGCDYYYKIYTPETVKARAELSTMIEGQHVV